MELTKRYGNNWCAFSPLESIWLFGWALLFYFMIPKYLPDFFVVFAVVYIAGVVHISMYVNKRNPKITGG